jgi:hypothetical protein
MSGLIGTCAYCYAIQAVTRIPLHGHAEQVDTPDLFVCQYLDFVPDLESMPPPIARHMGYFQLQPGDCEACRHYIPAGITMMDDLMESRERVKG